MLYQNVSGLVHFKFTSLTDLSLELGGLGVTHRVFEAVDANPKIREKKGLNSLNLIGEKTRCGKPGIRKRSECPNAYMRADSCAVEDRVATSINRILAGAVIPVSTNLLLRSKKYCVVQCTT